MLKNNKAVTLIELLLGMIIGAVVMLTIGVISQVGPQSYDTMEKQSQVYQDIMYGFDMMKHDIREAHTVAKENWHKTAWVSDMLIADQSAFGLCQPAKSTTVSLVYLKDKTKENEQDILLKDASLTTTLTLTMDAANHCVLMRIQGTKNKESFDLSTCITKRN